MPIRVLIVDDSVFMRSMLKSALSDPDNIEVVGTAQNGNDGLAKIRSLKPDVVTLDIEMPGLSGMEVLRRVMKDAPLPIVMVSTKTQKGAQATLEALDLGAVDYVAKPLAEKSATLESFRSSVIRAVRTASRANLGRLGAAAGAKIVTAKAISAPPDSLVAIGISAGGPVTLHKMIPAIPNSFPPIVITQHMPADFTGPFADRLNATSPTTVTEAKTNDPLLKGTIHIAPGSHHLKVARHHGRLIAALDQGPKVAGFRPSVDVLFESVASTVGSRSVGVIMTGMGCDGSVGVRLLKKMGGLTIAQDQATSIVYGMPKAAAETGCIDKVVPLEKIPSAIAQALQSLEVEMGV
ncbi:MAG: chemotaxis response regulator protein-glutamate methylesterase [Phycisphaerae bacterium]